MSAGLCSHRRASFGWILHGPTIKRLRRLDGGMPIRQNFVAEGPSPGSEGGREGAPPLAPFHMQSHNVTPRKLAATSK